MNRIVGVIVHNWPLKLAATGLAMLLYGGVVLSQNTQTFNGAIPVDVKGKPEGTVLLSPIPPVTQVRYFAPPDITPVTDTFVAEVDLSGVDPQAGVASVAVTMRSVDPRITILSFEPAFVSVRLEEVTTKDVPVKVSIGPLASGLELGETTVVPETVTVSGPESAIAQVASGARRCRHRPGRPRLRPGRAAHRRRCARERRATRSRSRRRRPASRSRSSPTARAGPCR